MNKIAAGSIATGVSIALILASADPALAAGGYGYGGSSHTITASAGAHGSISPEGAVVVSDGDDQTFTINPDTGYRTDAVTVDGHGVSHSSNFSYTFSGVTSDHTITATFVKINHGGGRSGGGGSQSTTVTTTTTGGQVLGAATYNFTVDLTIGSRGADVIALQNFLITNGYAIPYGATGYFGIQTRAALAAYQAANGISPAVGYFGPITRAQISTGNIIGTSTTHS